MESAPPPVTIPRQQESSRSHQFGPPAGYQPIILPGESISKYRGLAQAAHSAAITCARSRLRASSRHWCRICRAHCRHFPGRRTHFAAPAVDAAGLSSERTRSLFRKNPQSRPQLQWTGIANFIGGIQRLLVLPRRRRPPRRFEEVVEEERRDRTLPPKHSDRAAAPAQEQVAAFAAPWDAGRGNHRRRRSRYRSLRTSVR